jgi:hypothetical protein
MAGAAHLPSAILDSRLVDGGSVHLAAERAKVRHKISEDGAHKLGRRVGGLHPMTVAFLQGSNTDSEPHELINQTHLDVVDAVRSNTLS